MPRDSFNFFSNKKRIFNFKLEVKAKLFIKSSVPNLLNLVCWWLPNTIHVLQNRISISVSLFFTCSPHSFYRTPILSLALRSSFQRVHHSIDGLSLHFRSILDVPFSLFKSFKRCKQLATQSQCYALYIRIVLSSVSSESDAYDSSVWIDGFVCEWAKPNATKFPKNSLANWKMSSKHNTFTNSRWRSIFVYLISVYEKER